MQHSTLVSKLATPFEHAKIYFSNSIAGVPDLDLNFGKQLVQFMQEYGADVLSEHVAYHNSEEKDAIMQRRLGITYSQIRQSTEYKYITRKICIDWVDQATHFIAIVNSPSHGVGMEIERALLRKERGLSAIPILCLAHESRYNKVSCMITGIAKTECDFSFSSYSSIEHAQAIINNFLAK